MYTDPLLNSSEAVRHKNGRSQRHLNTKKETKRRYDLQKLVHDIRLLSKQQIQTNITLHYTQHLIETSTNNNEKKEMTSIVIAK